MTTRTALCSAGLKIGVAAVTLFLAACDDSEVVWKEEVKSPDGYWAAQAEVKQGGGPGNASLDTTVSLFRTNDPKPFMILGLDDNTVETAKVQMKWRDNRTLDISHFPEAKVGFQAVKAGGDVTIDLHLIH